MNNHILLIELIFDNGYWGCMMICCSTYDFILLMEIFQTIYLVEYLFVFWSNVYSVMGRMFIRLLVECLFVYGSNVYSFMGRMFIRPYDNNNLLMLTFSPIIRCNSFMFTRSCVMLSRSRMVTVLSSNVW